jgi:hypothetical protein
LHHRLYTALEPEFQMDVAFCKQLEEAAGCNLPDSLKVKISELVLKHCHMSSLYVNLDLPFVASLPTDIKLLLGKLMNYATNLQDRTKSLVVELLKAIAETEKSDSDFGDLHASSSDSDYNPPPQPPAPSSCDNSGHFSHPNQPCSISFFFNSLSYTFFHPHI